MPNTAVLSWLGRFAAHGLLLCIVSLFYAHNQLTLTYTSMMVGIAALAVGPQLGAPHPAAVGKILWTDPFCAFVWFIYMAMTNPLAHTPMATALSYVHALGGDYVGENARIVMNTVASPVWLSFIAVYCGVSLTHYVCRMSIEPLGFVSTSALSFFVVVSMALSQIFWTFVLGVASSAGYVSEAERLAPLGAKNVLLSLPFIAIALTHGAAFVNDIRVYGFARAVEAAMCIATLVVVANISHHSF